MSEKEICIIEPQRLGIWTAAAFILALLALVMSLVGMKRANEALVLTQAEVLLLNKKIEALQKKDIAPTAAPARAAM